VDVFFETRCILLFLCCSFFVLLCANKRVNIALYYALLLKRSDMARV